MLRFQEIELARLRPWEDNPRRNEPAVAAVAESIRSFGFNSYRAIVMRDYHWSTIQRYIDYFARNPERAHELGINIGGAMA